MLSALPWILFFSGGNTSATIRPMQLERILHSQGFGSRKHCRLLIENGWVTVNGILCETPRAEFETTDLQFGVDDQAWRYRENVYVLLHKPAGYECSRSPQSHPSVLRLLPDPLVERGIQPVGRLDQDTTGLLLLSDDGPFIHHISSPKHHIPKTYHATTRHPITPEFLQKLRDGVLLHGEEHTLAASHVQQLGETQVEITIEQGIYHQVKRMIAAASNRCEALHRHAIQGLDLQGLAEGEWRYLDAAEVEALQG